MKYKGKILEKNGLKNLKEEWSLIRVVFHQGFDCVVNTNTKTQVHFVLHEHMNQVLWNFDTSHYTLTLSANS